MVVPPQILIRGRPPMRAFSIRALVGNWSVDGILASWIQEWAG